MNNTFMTSSEAAEYLRIKRDRIYRYKTIPYYAPDGKQRLYKKEDLDRWLESGKHGGTGQ